MTYHKKKELIPQVQIGFSTSQSFVSRAIRFFTGAEVSHVFLSYHDPIYNRDVILEAMPNGMVINHFNSCLQDAIFVYLVTPKYDVSKLLEAAGEWLGSKYDYPGLFGFIIVSIGRYFKKKWKNPLQASKAMFCSESVVKGLQACNYPGSNLLESGQCSPQDLFEFFMAENER